MAEDIKLPKLGRTRRSSGWHMDVKTVVIIVLTCALSAGWAWDHVRLARRLKDAEAAAVKAAAGAQGRTPSSMLGLLNEVREQDISLIDSDESGP